MVARLTSSRPARVSTTTSIPSVAQHRRRCRHARARARRTTIAVVRFVPPSRASRPFVIDRHTTLRRYPSTQSVSNLFNPGIDQAPSTAPVETHPSEAAERQRPLGGVASEDARTIDIERASQRGPARPSAPAARPVRRLGGRPPGPEPRQPQRPRVGRDARPRPGGPQLRPRARHRVRPLRLDPHPRRAARRAARPRLGEPFGAGPGPGSAGRQRGADQQARPDADAGRGRPRARRRRPRPCTSSSTTSTARRSSTTTRSCSTATPSRSSPTDDAGPEDTILDREKKAYLMDAVHALPERLPPRRHRLLLRGALDAGARRRARRERVAHLAAARRGAAAC